MGQHVDPIRREKASYKQLNLGKLTSAFVQLLVAIYSLGELLCCWNRYVNKPLFYNYIQWYRHAFCSSPESSSISLLGNAITYIWLAAFCNFLFWEKHIPVKSHVKYLYTILRDTMHFTENRDREEDG